jgi:hypothetical protein
MPDHNNLPVSRVCCTANRGWCELVTHAPGIGQESGRDANSLVVTCLDGKHNFGQASLRLNLNSSIAARSQERSSGLL